MIPRRVSVATVVNRKTWSSSQWRKALSSVLVQSYCSYFFTVVTFSIHFILIVVFVLKDFENFCRTATLRRERQADCSKCLHSSHGRNPNSYIKEMSLCAHMFGHMCTQTHTPCRKTNGIITIENRKWSWDNIERRNRCPKLTKVAASVIVKGFSLAPGLGKINLGTVRHAWIKQSRWFLWHHQQQGQSSSSFGPFIALGSKQEKQCQDSDSWAPEAG